MKTRLATSALCMALCIFAPASMQAAKKPDVAISYDPKKPSRELGPVWLSYCFGRLHYVLEHPDEYPKKPGKVWIPSQEEEGHGRLLGLDAYRSLKKSGKLQSDAYWEDVSAVSDADFLKEYVWTFFRRDSWPDTSAPAKLKEFDEWRALKIPNHKPYTNGDISVKRG